MLRFAISPLASYFNLKRVNGLFHRRVRLLGRRFKAENWIDFANKTTYDVVVEDLRRTLAMLTSRRRKFSEATKNSSSSRVKYIKKYSSRKSNFTWAVAGDRSSNERDFHCKFMQKSWKKWYAAKKHPESRCNFHFSRRRRSVFQYRRSSTWFLTLDSND